MRIDILRTNYHERELIGNGLKAAIKPRFHLNLFQNMAHEIDM